MRSKSCSFRHRSERGFSFIEIIIVMGAMAVLLGLAVGYIANLGRSTYIAQTKAMLQETAHACLSASMGGKRAVLMLRTQQTEDGYTQYVIGASIARPVITHQFESLDFASEARTPMVQGQVELDRVGGRIGNAATFQGGHLLFRPSSVFAMTEGLEFDVWIKPDPRKTLMSLMRGEEAYEVQLVQSGGGDTYDVRLKLKVRKAADDGRTAAADKTYETKGGPVIADGRWQQLQISWQGMDPSIRVNGLEVFEGDGKSRGPGGALNPEEVSRVQRIAVGERGAIALSISSSSNPYFGGMDGFRLLGVFQSEDFERVLPGDLEVLFPPVPLRIAFYNGGLDPDVHSGDQIIRVKDLGNPEDPAIRLTIGMYGTIASDFESPSAGGGPEAANTKDGRQPSSSDDGSKEGK